MERIGGCVRLSGYPRFRQLWSLVSYSRTRKSLTFLVRGGEETTKKTWGDEKRDEKKTFFGCCWYGGDRLHGSTSV